MKSKESLFEKLLPASLKNSISNGLTGRNYQLLRLMLCSIMLLISMVPVLVVASLGYHNYGHLVNKTERQQTEWQLDGKIKSIEHMIESLTSIVQFTARNDRYAELIVGDNLRDLYERLNRQYVYFADLGVIDQDGIQRAYYGPYALMGANYSRETWFKEVIEQNLYISRVYTGYRHVPHFAIAVSNINPLTQQPWVLRATIDATTLQRFINTIKTNASDDLFLIDEDGVLQTESSYYGRPLTKIDIHLVPGFQEIVSRDQEQLSQITSDIKRTPWTLVLLKKSYVHQSDWKNFRNTLFLIVVTCLLLSMVIVCTLVMALTEVIRRADTMQIGMLKEAEHTDKLASIGRLAAGVGHEINNPLAIIGQKTGLIEDFLILSEDFKHKQVISDSLRVINQSVDRCKAITHRLLGFARRTDVVIELLQVNDVIKEVLLFLDNALLYSRIKLELHLDDLLPQVTSDRMQLQQVFLNVLNNAIDAIGKDGLISIRTHTIAGDIRVVIEDNGPGIPDDILPHIFEPFYTTKETGKGTGLGLSITYGLIKKLGGDITVRTHLGQGTAFTITIPLRNE
ncbi:MAG: ATP-binding protein, partial [Desulfofustis sp.]|nr:ATP-binding protein [Desulfofustis sp.]